MRNSRRPGRRSCPLIDHHLRTSSRGSKVFFPHQNRIIIFRGPGGSFVGSRDRKLSSMISFVDSTSVFGPTIRGSSHLLPSLPACQTLELSSSLHALASGTCQG